LPSQHRGVIGDLTVQLLTFELADRSFGLPSHLLLEVARAVAVEPLPGSPSIVEGIINVRGALVPVLDIRARLGLPPRPLTPDQHLIIARSGPRVVALRVDCARDLIAVDQDAIEATDRVAPGLEHVAGVAKLADGLLVIHDLEGFLSLDEARQVDGALTEVMAGLTLGEA
jgi:purine-binding chemotaxis protein CheW